MLKPYGLHIRNVLLCAVAAVCLGAERSCYLAQKFLNSDSATEDAWAAGEDSARAYANSIVPIPTGPTNDVPFSAGDTSLLKSIQLSKRHGANDKRFLALSATTPSSILAEITLVKGEEYIKDSIFRAGWYPMAVIKLSDSTHGDSVRYPKLKLRGGTSWVYIRHVSDTTWAASLVHLAGTAIHQDSLAITAEVDSLRPAPVARFMWSDSDEIIWGTCHKACCKVAAAL